MSRTRTAIANATDLLDAMSLGETHNESACLEAPKAILPDLLRIAKGRVALDWCDCGEYTDVWTTGKKKQRAIVHHAE